MGNEVSGQTARQSLAAFTEKRAATQGSGGTATAITDLTASAVTGTARNPNGGGGVYSLGPLDPNGPSAQDPTLRRHHPNSRRGSGARDGGHGGAVDDGGGSVWSARVETGISDDGAGYPNDINNISNGAGSYKGGSGATGHVYGGSATAATTAGGNNTYVGENDDDGEDADTDSLSSLESTTSSSSGSSSTGSGTVMRFPSDNDFFSYHGSGRMNMGGANATGSNSNNNMSSEQRRAAYLLKRRAAGRRLTEEEKGKYSTLGPPVKITKKDGTTTTVVEPPAVEYTPRKPSGRLVTPSTNSGSAGGGGGGRNPKRLMTAVDSRTTSHGNGNGAKNKEDDDLDRSPSLFRMESQLGSAFGSFVGRGTDDDDDDTDGGGGMYYGSNLNALRRKRSAKDNNNNDNDAGDLDMAGTSTFNLGDMRDSQSNRSLLRRRSSRNMLPSGGGAGAGKTSLYYAKAGSEGATPAGGKGKVSRQAARMSKMSSFFEPNAAVSAAASGMDLLLDSAGNGDGDGGFLMPSGSSNQAQTKYTQSGGGGGGNANNATDPLHLSRYGSLAASFTSDMGLGLYDISPDENNGNNANHKKGLSDAALVSASGGGPWLNGYRTLANGTDGTGNGNGAPSSSSGLARKGSARKLRKGNNNNNNSNSSYNEDSDGSGAPAQSFSSGSLREGKLRGKTANANGANQSSNGSGTANGNGNGRNSANKINQGSVNKLAAANGQLNPQHSSSGFYFDGNSVYSSEEEESSGHRGGERHGRMLLGLVRGGNMSDASLGDIDGSSDDSGPHRGGSRQHSESSFNSASSRFSSQSSRSNNSGRDVRRTSSGRKKDKVEKKSVDSLKKKAQRVRDSSVSSAESLRPSHRPSSNNNKEKGANSSSTSKKSKNANGTNASAAAGAAAATAVPLMPSNSGSGSTMTPAPPPSGRSADSFDRRRPTSTSTAVNNGGAMPNAESIAHHSGNANAMGTYHSQSASPYGMLPSNGSGSSSLPSTRTAPAMSHGNGFGYMGSLPAGNNSYTNYHFANLAHGPHGPNTAQTASGGLLPAISPSNSNGNNNSNSHESGNGKQQVGGVASFGRASVQMLPTFRTTGGGGGGGGGNANGNNAVILKTVAGNGRTPSTPLVTTAQNHHHPVNSGSQHNRSENNAIATAPSSPAAGSGANNRRSNNNAIGAGPISSSVPNSATNRGTNNNGGKGSSSPRTGGGGGVAELPTLKNLRYMNTNTDVDSGLDSEGDCETQRTSFSSASAHLFVNSSSKGNHRSPTKTAEGPGGHSPTRRAGQAESSAAAGQTASNINGTAPKGGSGAHDGNDFAMRQASSNSDHFYLLRSGSGFDEKAGGSGGGGNGNGNGNAGGPHKRRRPQTEAFNVWQVNADKIKNLIAAQQNSGGGSGDGGANEDSGTASAISTSSGGFGTGGEDGLLSGYEFK